MAYPDDTLVPTQGSVPGILSGVSPWASLWQPGLSGTKNALDQTGGAATDPVTPLPPIKAEETVEEKKKRRLRKPDLESQATLDQNTNPFGFTGAPSTPAPPERKPDLELQTKLDQNINPFGLLTRSTVADVMSRPGPDAYGQSTISTKAPASAAVPTDTSRPGPDAYGRLADKAPDLPPPVEVKSAPVKEATLTPDEAVDGRNKTETSRSDTAPGTPTSPGHGSGSIDENNRVLSGAPPPASPEAVTGGSMLDKLLTGFGNWRDQNRLTLLAMAGGLAGSQSIGQGLGRAFTAAVPAQEHDIANSHFNTTVRALQGMGLSPEVATAAAGNPATLQAMLGQSMGLTAPAHIITTDAAGNQHINVWNGRPLGNGGAFISTRPGGGTGNEEDALPAQYDPVTRRDEAYIAAVKKADSKTGEALEAALRGDIDLKGRKLQFLEPMAARAQQGWSMQSYHEMQRTRDDFTPQGTSGKNLTAIETAITHVDRMKKNADALKNFEIMPALNAPYNLIRGQLSPDYQTKVAKFRADATGSSGELAKAFRSAGMSEADIDRWLKSFNENSSPATITGAADEAMHMLDGRLDALADSYNRGMMITGTKRLAPEDLIKNPKIRQLHDQLAGIPESERKTVTDPAKVEADVPPPGDRQVNKIYQTPRGPARWLGSGWELVDAK